MTNVPLYPFATTEQDNLLSATRIGMKSGPAARMNGESFTEYKRRQKLDRFIQNLKIKSGVLVWSSKRSGLGMDYNRHRALMAFSNHALRDETLDTGLGTYVRAIPKQKKKK